MQPRRAEDGLCSSQEHFQTFGRRTGRAMEGFSVLALSKATPLIYHSCSIYLYLVNSSLPYYIQLIFKSVLFPLVGIQELFHAFSTSAPATKHPKKIRLVRDCSKNRKRYLLNTLLTELHEEGAGGPREFHVLYGHSSSWARVHAHH